MKLSPFTLYNTGYRNTHSHEYSITAVLNHMYMYFTYDDLLCPSNTSQLNYKSVFICLLFYFRIFRSYGDVTVAYEGLQILGQCDRHLELYSRKFEGSLSCHTSCDTGPRFWLTPQHKHVKHVVERTPTPPHPADLWLKVKVKQWVFLNLDNLYLKYQNFNEF